jgi:hypothetical protein
VLIYLFRCGSSQNSWLPADSERLRSGECMLEENLVTKLSPQLQWLV